MAYFEGTATSYLDLLSVLASILAAENGSGEPEFGAGNAGNGTITKPTGASGAPTETWTLTCTLAGGDATATFSVVGSVTGADGTATSGSAYSGTVLFTISAGGTDWELGDTISFELSRLGWTVLKNTTSSYTADGEVYFKGVGLGGSEEIFVNIEAKSDSGNAKYYWRLQGATDFDTGNAFDGQVGAIPTGQGVPLVWLESGSIDYAIAANAQRFVVLAQIGSQQQICYCGFVDRLAQPNVYPYPLFIGGTHWDETEDGSDTASPHTNFTKDFSFTANDKSSAHLCLPGTIWARARGFNGTTSGLPTPFVLISPQGTIGETGATYGLVPAPSGEYPLFPSNVLAHTRTFADSETDTYNGDWALVGTLDGIAFTTGFDLSSDDLIANKRWKAFQNVFRSGRTDFSALRRA